MKKFSKLIGFIVIFMIMMATMCSVSFAATVGKALTKPEDGWQRYNAVNPLIIYTGNYKQYSSDGMYIANGGVGTAKFKFYGSKLRIISYRTTDAYSKSVNIIVDGTVVENYSSTSSSEYGLYYLLVYENTNLSLGTHSVEIIPTDSTPYGTLLFGIDIEDTGKLVSQFQPTNLETFPVDSKIDLYWGAATDATSYNIKRATTPGGLYETIATTSATTYTDIDVKNGTTYYYVISSIVNGTESPNSFPEASATPQQTTQLKLVLELNEAKQLSISNELSDNAEMEWTSTNSTVATVDINGKVKALKPGNTVITCTSEEYTESINVLVVDLEYQLAVDLNVSDTCRLTVDDLVNTTKAATWSAYDSTIATVSAKGKVTAISEGLTYIVASDKDGNEIGRIYIRVRN